MSINGLLLDCEPLALPSTAAVTDRDLRRIEPLQHVLLSPFDYESVDAWRGVVNDALVQAVGADKAMFQLPLAGVRLHYCRDVAESALTEYEELMPSLERVARISGRETTRRRQSVDSVAGPPRLVLPQRLFQRARRPAAGFRCHVGGSSGWDDTGTSCAARLS